MALIIAAELGAFAIWGYAIATRIERAKKLRAEVNIYQAATQLAYFTGGTQQCALDFSRAAADVNELATALQLADETAFRKGETQALRHLASLQLKPNTPACQSFAREQAGLPRGLVALVARLREDMF